MRFVSFAACCLTSLAAAQTPLFADDFETGTLLTSEAPPGKWDSRSGDATVNVTALAAAAHRGAFGLRLSDTNAATNVTAYVSHGEPARLGDYHVRLWLRINAGTTQSVYPVGVFSTQGSVATTELEVLNAGPRLNASGWEQSGTYTSDPITMSAGNGWHLLELSMLGVGSGSARRQAWLDGTQVVDRVSNFASGAIDRLQLGQYFGVTGYTGTIDFDDVRVSTSPHASRVALTVPITSAPAETCLAGSVGLVSSGGQLTTSPYAVTFTLSATGANAQTFSGSGCTTAANAVTLGAGSGSATFSVRLNAAGNAQLTVAQVDFLPHPASTLTATGRINGQSCMSGPACTSGLCSNGTCVAMFPDAGPDAGVDAGVDAGADAGSDAGSAGGGSAGGGSAGGGSAGGGSTGGGSAGGGSTGGGAQGPLALDVGCGCTTGAGAVWLGLVLVALRRRRR